MNLTVARLTQAHVDARTDDILAAAVSLFASRGIEKTTMADVAAEAGISTGAVYRYFPGKEALLTAVFERDMRESAEQFARAAEEKGAGLRALIHVGEKVANTEDVGGCALWLETRLAGLRDPEGMGAHQRRIHDSIRANIRTLVEASQTGREVDPSLDPAALSTLLFAVACGLQMDTAETGDGQRSREALNLLTRLLLLSGEHPAAPA